MRLQITNVKPWRAWDNETKKAGERLGTTYTVIRYKARGPVLVDVKVPETEAITVDEIRDRAAHHTAVWADFADYEEDAYARDSNVYYTATASAVELVLDIGDIAID